MTEQKSQTLLLITVAALVVGSTGYLYHVDTQYLWLRFSPRPLYVTLVVLAVAVAPFTAIALGKRLNAGPVVALLLATVGGALAAASFSPHAGAVWGLVIGVVLVYPRSSLARLCYAAILLGVVSSASFGIVMLTRRIFFDLPNLWLPAVVLCVAVGLCGRVLLTVPFPNRMRPEHKSARRNVVAKVGFAVTAILMVLFAGICGWHSELERRIYSIESKQGSVTFGRRSSLVALLKESWRRRDWKPVLEMPFDPQGWAEDTAREMLLGGPVVRVKLVNPTPGDVRTLSSFEDLASLAIVGWQTDDLALSELPQLPKVTDLGLHSTSVTGKFLSDPRLLPTLTSLSARVCSFDDSGVLFLARRRGLYSVQLHATAVTPGGLAALHELPNPLRLHADVNVDGALPILIELLQSPNPGIRAWAANRLTKVGPEAISATHALIAARQDSSPQVQYEAAQALVAIGTPEALSGAVPVLIRNLETRDSVQTYGYTPALFTLRSIGPLAASAVPALARRLRASDEMYGTILDTLAAIGTDEAFAAGEQVLFELRGEAVALNNEADGPRSVQAIDAALATLRIRKAVGSEYEMRHKYRLEGRYEEALAVYERLFEAQRHYLGHSHEETYRSLFYLANLNWTLRRHAVAEPMLERYVEFARNLDKTFGMLGIALTQLGSIRFGQQRYAEAELFYYEALTRKRPERWDYHNTRRLLGAALAKQGKFVEAKSELASAYEGLERTQRQIRKPLRPSRLMKAGSELVDVCTQLGEPEEAAQWQERLRELESESGN